MLMLMLSMMMMMMMSRFIRRTLLLPRMRMPDRPMDSVMAGMFAVAVVVVVVETSGRIWPTSFKNSFHNRLGLW